MADGDANYSPEIARNLREILDSDRFVTECFNRRSLTISQALCLLWHNQDSGEEFLEENRALRCTVMLLLLLLLTCTCLERSTLKMLR